MDVKALKGVNMADEEFKGMLRACGVTKKGEAFARVIWRAANDIFAVIPDNEEPFDMASFAYRLLCCKASDVQEARLLKAKTKKSRKRTPCTTEDLNRGSGLLTVK